MRTHQRVVSETSGAGKRLIRRIAVNDVTITCQRERAPEACIHEYACVSLPLKCLDLFFRKYGALYFPKPTLKKTVQVVTNQAVEAVPIEVKECCCTLDRIQPLRVECFTN